MSDFEIKIFAPEHIPEAAEIERLCFSEPWSEDALLYMCTSQNTYAIAALIDGRLAAYGGCEFAPPEANIVNITQCSESDLPRKEKRIGELCDDDIFTYVTLKDCEIVFKDGAFSNVYERYVQITPINKRVKPNKSMDGWATLLCDKEGGSIYSITNSLCRWR